MGKGKYISYFLKNIPGALKIRFFHKTRRTSSFAGQKHISMESTDLLLKEAIDAGKPFAAIRFGGMELCALNGYEKRRLGLKKTYKEGVRKVMKVNAGYYPTDDESLDLYAKRFLTKLKEADILGIHGYHMEDYFIREYCPQAKLGLYEAMEPLHGDFISHLEGKKVLVISPFKEEIEAQYARKELLFPKGSNRLPDFASLTVIKPPMSQGDVVPEKSSLEALEEMKKAIDQTDFDIALIGAGVYGSLLALHIKSIGKSAIQTGGATMTLFGIMGKRWENRVHVSQYFNEYWIRPHEKIPGYQKIDAGAYW